MTSSQNALTVVIAYYSRFGTVGMLAERIAAGVNAVDGARAELLEIQDRPVEEILPGETAEQMALRRAALLNTLAGADAIVVGAPSYFGGMASAVKRLFEDVATAATPQSADRTRPWHGHLFRDKVGGAFAASATPHGGNEETNRSILTMMMHLGMIVVTPGQHLPILDRDRAPYGPTATAGADGHRPPSVEESADAEEHGRRIAEITTWMRLGREQWQQREAGNLHVSPGTLRGVQDPGSRR
jgi:NAD(P)H dehydrogenase (quinone)